MYFVTIPLHLNNIMLGKTILKREREIILSLILYIRKIFAYESMEFIFL